MKTKFFGNWFLIVIGMMTGAGLCCGFLFLVNRGRDAQVRRIAQAEHAAWALFESRVLDEIGRFKGTAGIVIRDLSGNREFAYQQNMPFASASLAKVPLMAACFVAAEQGKVRLDRRVALKPSDKFTGSGVLKNMPAGTAVSVERLIGLMIYDSDNTATNMVTDLLGIEYIQNTFKDFGLEATTLSRRIADYRSRDNGVENYTTASEMAGLLERIYHRSLGSTRVSDQCIRMLKLNRMNDRIPRFLPAELAVAHKTGLEKGVCHDAGIVFSPLGDVIIVVLTKHPDKDSAAAKEFIAQVSRHAYGYVEQARGKTYGHDHSRYTQAAQTGG